VNELRPQDRVAIVVYAGNAGLVLPSTPGSNKGAISAAINDLEAGGSTAGGEGIKLAYKVAKDNFLQNGNNRVILATDGDFNVGISSDGELEQLIESKRRDHIYLTVLGFGTGNIKDSKMELLADKGNGNYAYIDTINEARKVFVQELGAGARPVFVFVEEFGGCARLVVVLINGFGAGGRLRRPSPGRGASVRWPRGRAGAPRRSARPPGTPRSRRSWAGRGSSRA